MVTRVLLPLPSTDVADSANGSIPSWRLLVSSPCILHGWDHDSRTSAFCSDVEGSRVVGGIADDRVDVISHLIDEGNASRGVVYIRICQGLGVLVQRLLEPACSPESL